MTVGFCFHSHITSKLHRLINHTGQSVQKGRAPILPILSHDIDWLRRSNFRRLTVLRIISISILFIGKETSVGISAATRKPCGRVPLRDRDGGHGRHGRHRELPVARVTTALRLEPRNRRT